MDHGPHSFPWSNLRVAMIFFTVYIHTYLSNQIGLSLDEQIGHTHPIYPILLFVAIKNIDCIAIVLFSFFIVILTIHWLTD